MTTSLNKLARRPSSDGRPRDGEPDTTPPRLSDFAWTNQGAAVATQRDGYISVVAPDKPTADQNRLLTLPAPAAPWSMTARMNVLHCAEWQGGGLCMMDSASSRLLLLGTLGAGVRLSRWYSPSAFFDSPFLGSAFQPPWLRMRNDGTNLYADISTDGYSWATVWTEGITAFLTKAPDRIGFFLAHNNAPSQGSLMSFKLG